MVLSQLFSEQQYYRVFHYYFRLFCQISALKPKAQGSTRPAVAVGGKRVLFSPKLWLVKNFSGDGNSATNLDVSDLAAVFDGIVTYVVNNPPMLEGLNYSETERQIFECILEFLYGCGYKGANTSDINNYVVNALTPEGRNKDEENTLCTLVKDVLESISSYTAGEATLFRRKIDDSSKVSGTFVLSDFVNNENDLQHNFNDVCMSAKLVHLMAMVPAATLMKQMIAKTTFINHYAIGSVDSNFTEWQAVDIAENSALHIIAVVFDSNVESSIELVNIVLSAIGLTPKRPNSNGLTPLHISCALDQCYGVQCFLKMVPVAMHLL